MTRRIVSIAAGLAAFLASSPPAALSAPSRGCTIAAQPLSFGSYDTMGTAPRDAQGRVSYRCSNRSGGGRDRDRGGKWLAEISLSRGQSGSYQRHLQGPRDRLRYNVFLDPQRQIVWGDGTGGTQVLTEHAKPNNKEVVIPVYGRVGAAQDVRAGRYTDSLVVTIDF